jgi:hypothetical protein
MIVSGASATMIAAVLTDCARIIEELYEDTEEEQYERLLDDIIKAIEVLR